jgi:hypothetical protein
MRPRLWRNRQGAEAPQDGLQELEASLKRSFEQLQQSSTEAGSSRHSSSQRISDADMMQAYHASWMDPSRERELPRQRAAAAAAVITLQRQQQLQQQQQQISNPAYNDLQDPITKQMGAADVSQYSWVAAYNRVGHKQLPKQLREFGWRLLHAGVKVGARRMLSARRQTPAQFTCLAQQCQQMPQLETFSHLFVECPVAAAVWQWFAQLWQQVQPGTVVPINSRVLLLDDFSTWAPPADKQLLWTQLRLLLLESIYAVRNSCSNSQRINSSNTAERSDAGNDGAGGNSPATAAAMQQQSSSSHDDQEPASGAQGSSSFTAKAVACRFRAELQKQLMREWSRVDVDVRIGCGIPASWLGGRSPVIEWDDFKRKWAGIYRVVREGAERQIRVDASVDGL